MAVAAGCGGGSVGPPINDAPDFDVLFAPASGAEIQLVRSEWNARSPSATDAQIEQVFTTSFGTMQGQATVISHRVDGSRHYGALFVPNGAPANAPIVVFLHASENGVSIPQAGTDFLIGGLGSLRDELVYVIPSYRSEELRVGGQVFLSEGSSSPWDRDVDDALGLVESVIALAPQAVDPSRVATIGVSRGGLVALLMAARDPGIDAAIELGGPTDFFGDFVRTIFEDVANGAPPNVAGLAYLKSRYIDPWLAGEVSTSTFRRELVRRSAVLFGNDLPRLQVHHGTSDVVVDVSQAEALINTMQGLGRVPPIFEGFLYAGAGHAITSLGGAPARAGAFLNDLWFSAAAMADLRVRRTGPGQAAVGDTLTYLISTSNSGPQQASLVSVTDTLPPGASFASASRGAIASGDVVRWPSIENLPSGASQVDTLVIVAQGSGPLTGIAAVTSVTTDPDPSDNRSSLTTTVSQPTPDLAALFAPPTGAEIAAVQADWASRSPASIQPAIVRTVQATSSGVSGEVRAIRHTVDGLTHYGSVFVPNGLAAGSAPIVIYLHPGEGGTQTPGPDMDQVVGALKNLSRDFVYVFPSFRGEPLRVGGTTYQSTGLKDFWDRDADDALALMEVVRATVPEADPSRIATFGVSRGGLVGLLMGARDARIDGVITLISPTDFTDPWVQGIVGGLANGQQASGDFWIFLNQRFVQPWVNGQLSLADIRAEFLKRSPVLFASSLPWTQIHHGTADPVVSVSQAQRLISAMSTLGRSPPAFEGYLYAGAGHDSSALPGSISRIRTFVESLWP